MKKTSLLIRVISASFLMLCSSYSCASLENISSNEEMITSAEKHLSYLKTHGNFPTYFPPEVVIVCYQNSIQDYVLEHYAYEHGADCFSNLYLLGDGHVGVIGGFGYGSPALAIKVERLIAWGVKKIIAVGTAGTLVNGMSIGDVVMCSKALGEDGVSHLYLPNGVSIAFSDQELIKQWETHFFENYPDYPKLRSVMAWSFSNPYRESKKDLARVVKQGCEVVEMEAAALNAMCSEKKVQTLSFFVISDSLSDGEWKPCFKDPIVDNNLKQLFDQVLKFCVAQCNDTR